MAPSVGRAQPARTDASRSSAQAAGGGDTSTVGEALWPAGATESQPGHSAAVYRPGGRLLVIAPTEPPMEIFKPPASLDLVGRRSLFLAGSIEMGLAEPWQARM